MSESAYNSPFLSRRFTESCCSSPARSISGQGPDILTDSDGEGDSCITEVPGTPDQTVIAGWVKFRDNRKWKQRWGVITKLSPAAGAKVIMACRNVEKAEEAASDIRKQCEALENTGSIVIVPLDLSSLKSVRKCAEELLETEEKIHILVNNAGIIASDKTNTEDGFEITFATNHLGHFLLTLLLLPKMVKSTPARIINVSSHAHRGKIHFDDLNFEKRQFKPLQAYQQSKLANILFAKELARRIENCLYLQLYRDSKDRYKQGHTKASLSLQHFLGLETGFTLDKESNTVAILCQDVVVVLAFDSRERLMQWQVKLSSHLSDGPHFLVLLSSAPQKARLQPGPARLHVQERGFCLSTGIPPTIAGLWQISHLRRYGVVEGRFCFEGGSRCGRGEGLHVLLTDQGEEISQTLKMAAIGQLQATRRRPVSRNMSVMDSPRRQPMRNLADLCDSSTISRADSPYTDLESNYGCGDSSSTDGWGPPPIERCMSCISKLGAMSRSSTATVTIGAPCWEHTCDRHSISSGSDSSGWSQAVTKPPARPPKPSSSPSPKKPAAPTPGSTYDNYDIPKIPYPVEPRMDEHYDTPRKLKECLFETVHKPCGCVVRYKQPEQERPCVCQRLMSCWANQDDVQALYATVDVSKKCQRNAPTSNQNPNYANITTNFPVTNNCTNYENMDFAQSLQLYENGKQVVEKANALCSKCGHAQGDYLMMELAKPGQPHPGYLPMSPAVKQRLSKALSSSNPNLGPALDRSNKPSGSAMLQANMYQRKQLLDSTDNLDLRRKRSNSADSSSRCEPEPENTSPCNCAQQAVRRSSSVPCKSNRDSSSSNDSGVFELPRRQHLCTSTLPRRSKSSDPLRDLSFHFQKPEGKCSSAEAEVPVCPSGSTSSGTSDMSDYFETLSVSSHSSGDAPPPSCTLRPRSGNEYLSLQRLIAPVPEERHN